MSMMFYGHMYSQVGVHESIISHILTPYMMTCGYQICIDLDSAEIFHKQTNRHACIPPIPLSCILKGTHVYTHVFVGVQVRWFVLKRFMERHGYPRVFHIGSEVMLYANVTQMAGE